MADTIIVSTELSLRVLHESDAEELFAVSDHNRDFFREWMSWLDTIKTAEDSLDFITLCTNQRVQGIALIFGIFRNDTLVGVAGFFSLDSAHQIASIGYWLAETAQGQGIMTDTCKALIQHAFAELGMNRVEIRVAEFNSKSRAIPERLGFTQEGILRDRENLYGTYVDHVMYSLLKSEYTTNH